MPLKKHFPPVRCLQTTRPKKIKKKLLVEKGGVHPQFGHSTSRLATFFFIFLKPPATCQAHLEAIGTSSLNPKTLQRKKFHREDASQKAFQQHDVHWATCFSGVFWCFLSWGHLGVALRSPKATPRWPQDPLRPPHVREKWGPGFRKLIWVGL